MTTDKHKQFIKERIKDSSNAILYRYIDETHKQALGLKKTIVMDDNGQLYFPLSGSDFEHKYGGDIFPVELFFYKKGNPYYMTAKGIAIKLGANFKTVNNVVRIQMDEVEYSELEGYTNNSLWTKCLQFFCKINTAIF